MEISSTTKSYLLLAIILVLVCFSYSNTLYSPLVLDDRSAFIAPANLYLEDLSVQSLQQLTQTRFGTRRLLPILSFALDHYWGDGSLRQFHLTNIAIHLLAAIALLLFLKALFSTRPARGHLHFLSPTAAAVFACGLWALHPVQTNAVTYIVQRMAAMTALFYFASLACYIYGRQQRRVIQKIIFFFLAILSAAGAYFSKENAVTLPLIILIVEFLFLSPGLAGTIRAKLGWRHLLIALVLLFIFLPFFAAYISQNYLGGYATRDFTLEERLLTQGRVIVFYLSLLMLPLPSRMNLDHDFLLSQSLLTPPTTIASLLVIAALLGLAARTYRTNPLLSFGITFFFLNLVIESSFIPLELVFEHRLYLPAAGFFIVIIVGLDYLAAKYLVSIKEGRKIVTIGMVIGFTLLSLLTTFRNNDWRDLYTIYADTAEKSPHKPRAQVNLGLALMNMEQYPEAVKVLEKAIDLGKGTGSEEFINAANNIIASDLLQEKYHQAVEHGEKLIQKIAAGMNFRTFHKFTANLGYAYLQTGNPEKALTVLTYGARTRPDFDRFYPLMEQAVTAADDAADNRNDSPTRQFQAAVYSRLAATMLAIRNYPKAAEYIAAGEAAAAGNNPIIQDLTVQYRQTIETNTQMARISEISNHPPYQHNRTYKVCLDLADFLLQYYPPLRDKPVQWLLETAGEQNPADPFVALRHAKWHSINARQEKAAAAFETLLTDHDDFPPGLVLAGNFFIQQHNKEKAAPILEHLLKMYPGYPGWLNYEEFLAQYRHEQKKGL